MPIITSTLPHGVTIPRTFTDDDAHDLVRTLADHYGWAYTVYRRTDIEKHLTPHPGAPSRRLSNEEWQRVNATIAWTAIATTAHRAIRDGDIITRVIRQAALQCAACDAPLTGPPTATWGLCPTCLNNADLSDLRQRPCPATGTGVPHQWTATACTACGVPAAGPAPSRHLTAVRTT